MNKNYNKKTIFNSLRFSLYTLLILGAIILAAYLNTSIYPVPIRYFALLLLAFCVQQYVYRFVRVNKAATSLVPFFFTIMWGIPIFNGYIYYDELTRYPSPPISSWFFNPINDHLMPLIYPLWLIEYQVFAGDYIVISTIFYITCVVGLIAFSMSIGTMAQDLSKYAKNVMILVASTPFQSWKLWFWKGCGDGPVTSFMFFSISLFLFSRSGNLTLISALLIVFLYFIAVFSSSLITVGFLFFSIFPLFDKKYRNAKSFAILMSCLAISLVYWVLRSRVVTSGLMWNNINKFGSSLHAVTFSYAFDNKIVFAMIITFLVAGISLALIKLHFLRLPMALGAAILFIGTLQLNGARGLIFASRHDFDGYHMFLPFIGLSILLAVASAAFIGKLGLKKMTIVLCVGGLWVAGNIFAVQKRLLADSDAVRLVRKDFFCDLRKLNEKYVADLSLASSPRVAEMNWCPLELLKDPEASHYGWCKIVTVGKLARFGKVNFKNSDSGHGPTPEAVEILAKWWGKSP
jgi:hypothetical protein